MIRATVILAFICASLAAPVFSQTPQAPQTQRPWTNQVDAAAIFEFDPDGGAGIALTPQVVRGFLKGPIAKPTREQSAALLTRRRAAEEAREGILSNESLYAPLWEENAFELQDGSVRPMTVREKAVFAELDAIDAGGRTNTALTYLAGASETERAGLADAICRMLEAGVRLAGRNSDGYRKIDGNWVLLDFEKGVVAGSRLAAPEVENALLRYELARHAILSGFALRTARSQPPLLATGANGPF